MMNVILWSKRSNVPTPEGKRSQSSWYDHNWVAVPFIGPNHGQRLRNALHGKVHRPSCGKFGGGSSLGEVTVLQYEPTAMNGQGAGILLVETLYHIGD